MLAETEDDNQAVEAEHAKTKEDLVRHFPGWMAAALAAGQRAVVRFSDVSLMQQIFFARHVDNFQIFVEDTLRAILSANPDLLHRAGAQVRLRDVLAHDNVRDFIQAEIDRRVRNLSFKSLEDLDKSVRAELDFSLFAADSKAASERLKFVRRVYDIRNLITHNYGVVDSFFARRYPEGGVEIGKPYKLRLEEMKDCWKVLLDASQDIEKRARAKFKLREEGPNGGKL